MVRSYNEPIEQYMVVINKQGQVFSGLKYGKEHWEYDWNLYKPLSINNVQIIQRNNYNTLELIPENEFTSSFH